MLFRAWHRGIREMDLVLGRFADRQLAVLSEIELSEFETWLDIPDQQIFAWVSGQQEAPCGDRYAAVSGLREFRARGLR